MLRSSDLRSAMFCYALLYSCYVIAMDCYVCAMHCYVRAMNCYDLLRSAGFRPGESRAKGRHRPYQHNP